jgi:hypothetical protein
MTPTRANLIVKLLLMNVLIIFLVINICACINDTTAEKNPMLGTWSVTTITVWGKKTNEGIWKLTKKGARAHIGDLKIKRDVYYKLSDDKARWLIYISRNPTSIGLRDFRNVEFEGEDKFTITDSGNIFIFKRLEDLE